MSPSDQRRALFSAICRVESGFVVSVLRTCGVSPQALADVAQDVLLAVWLQFADYDVTRPIRPWLYAFAVRFARDHCRLARHRHEKLTAELPELPDNAPSTENMMVTEHDRRVALGAIERLPPRLRAVVMMRAEGMSMPQIAATLGVPIDTGFSRLRRALQLARRYVYLAHAQEAHQNAAKKKRHVDHGSNRPTYHPHPQAARADAGASRRAGRGRSGNLKGHLSNIERGLVAPTVPTLRKIAAKVGVDLPYLVTLPEESKHQALIERTRFMSVAEVDELLKKLGPVPAASPPRKRRRTLRLVVSRPRRR